MRRTPPMVSDPNVLPLIDVLLVLLVIFMLGAAPGILKVLTLQLPIPTGKGEGTPIVLTVSAGPRYVINGRELRPTTLEEDLRTIYQGRPERVLFVKGDRGLRYQDVVRAFDAARGAGIHSTAVVLRSSR